MEFDAAIPLLTTSNNQNHVVSRTIFDHPIFKHIFFVLFLNTAIIGLFTEFIGEKKKVWEFFDNYVIKVFNKHKKLRNLSA